MASCSCSTQREIKEVAYKYSYAMANYDVEEAQRYASDETRNTTLVRAQQYMALIDSSYIQSDTPAKIKIREVSVINDTQAYAIYHKKTPLKNFKDTLYLVKREGKWQAHAPLIVVEAPKSTRIKQPGEIKDAPRNLPKNLK